MIFCSREWLSRPSLLFYTLVSVGEIRLGAGVLPLRQRARDVVGVPRLILVTRETMKVERPTRTLCCLLSFG